MKPNFIRTDKPPREMKQKVETELKMRLKYNKTEIETKEGPKMKMKHMIETILKLKHGDLKNY